MKPGLVTRFTLPIVLLAGTLLNLPTMDSGFLADDVYHLGIMERPDLFPGIGPLSLYTFIDDTKDRMGPIQGDFKPWWASEEFRQNFWRPLSCIFHHIDHALYGLNAWGYHLTNLLLWALLLVMVYLLYRELARDSDKGPMVVLMAGLFFAIDEAHVFNVAWIAHRYALLGTALSMGSLLLYHRFRRDGGPWKLVAALGLLCLGLLSDEGTVSMALWILAYEMCLGRDRLSRCILAMTPFVLIIAIYLVFYAVTGHGSAGSDNYLNPLKSPGAFITSALFERIPFLVMGMLTPVPSELFYKHILSDGSWMLVLAWGLALVFVLALIPHLRRDAFARFMALGALLSLLPRAAAYPHDRMLLLPTVGGAWVLASCVADYLKSQRHPLSWFKKSVAVILLIMHMGVAPVRNVIGTQFYEMTAKKMWKAAVDSEMPSAAEAENARVLLLATPEVGHFIPGLRWLAGHSFPKAAWVVTTGGGEYRFRQLGPKTFAIRIVSGNFLRGIETRTCRQNLDFKKGEVYRQGAMEVVIVEVVAGRVREIEVSIDRDLDHSDVWFAIWNGYKFIRKKMAPWKPPGMRERRRNVDRP